MNRSSKQHWRSGLTLVEVVAGLALLATLLVTILLAFGAHAGQIRQAERRLEAIAAADELLREWSHADGIPEVGSQEQLAGHENLAWRTVNSPTQPSPGQIISQVRLEIVRRTGTRETEILTAVDLFAVTKHSVKTSP